MIHFVCVSLCTYEGFAFLCRVVYVSDESVPSFLIRDSTHTRDTCTFVFS